MADFTGNDINDAKKRVEEMRRRSQSFVENENNGKEKNADEINHKKENGNKPENSDSVGILGSLFSSLGLSKSDDSSSTLILALILILSKEGADNKLILALLYILL